MLNLLSNIFKLHPEKFFLILSQLLNAFLSLIIGKLIAIYVLPNDFGDFNLEFAAYTFCFTLIISPFLQYMKNYSVVNLEKEGHIQALRLLFILITICLLALFIIFKFYFRTSNLILAIILMTLPLNVFFNLLIDYFNIKGFLKVFSLSNLSKTFFSLLVLLLFILFIKDSINKVLLLWVLQIVGFVFGIIFFVKKYKLYLNVNIKKKFNFFIKKYFKYSWPLIVLAFWGWLNNYMDRYIIEYFMNSTYVGIYNANLGVGSKFFIIINPIFLALVTPIVFSSTNDLEFKIKQTKKIAFNYSLFSLFILLLNYFFYDLIGSLLLSQFYSEGFYLIFWTALAYFIITLTYIYEQLFYADNKTAYILYSNIICAIINVVFCLIMVPLFGLAGVIFSLILASLARFIFTLFIFKNYLNENCIIRK